MKCADLQPVLVEGLVGLVDLIRNASHDWVCQQLTALL